MGAHTLTFTKKHCNSLSGCKRDNSDVVCGKHGRDQEMGREGNNKLAVHFFTSS